MLLFQQNNSESPRTNYLLSGPYFLVTRSLVNDGIALENDIEFVCVKRVAGSHADVLFGWDFVRGSWLSDVGDVDVEIFFTPAPRMLERPAWQLGVVNFVIQQQIPIISRTIQICPISDLEIVFYPFQSF